MVPVVVAMVVLVLISGTMFLFMRRRCRRFWRYRLFGGVRNEGGRR